MVSTRDLIAETECFIAEYQEIVNNDPYNLSAVLTLNSLEAHLASLKKDKEEEI